MLIVLDENARKTVRKLEKRKEFVKVIESQLEKMNTKPQGEVIAICEFCGHKFLIEGREHKGKIRIKYIDSLTIESLD